MISKSKPTIVLCDVESTLYPEIWIELAKATKIKDFHLTTRDINDFNKLMEHRITLLNKHKLDLKQIEKIVKKIEPLKGAVEFVKKLRKKYPVIFLSDTFYEFANIFLPHFEYPAIFCHSFKTKNGKIHGTHLRRSDKGEVAKSLQNLGFQIIAIGDSHNDLGMLKTAELGIFMNATEDLSKKHGKIKAFDSYPKVLKFIEQNTK